MILTRYSKNYILSSNLQFYFQKLQYRPFNTKSILNMPLVDPVTNSAGGDKTAQWQNKLVGKKIGETSDAVVC